MNIGFSYKASKKEYWYLSVLMQIFALIIILCVIIAAFVWNMSINIRFTFDGTSDSQQINFLKLPNGTNTVVYGDIYYSLKKAELISSIFISNIDLNSDNIITKNEYVLFEINQEWNQYDKDINSFINFYEFKQEFFKSYLFKDIAQIIQDNKNGKFDGQIFFENIKIAQQQNINTNFTFYP